MIPIITDALQPINILAINVSGADACKFLQGQLTCDVTALADGKYTLGAYCNIKGKVESLFYVMRSGNDYLLFLISMCFMIPMPIHLDFLG